MTVKDALHLNENNPEVLADVGSDLIQLDNSETGKDLVEKAITISAAPPSWYFGLIVGYFYLHNQTEKALKYARKYYDDGSLQSSMILAATLVKSGKRKEALQIYGKLNQDYPRFAKDRKQIVDSWKLPENMGSWYYLV